MLGNAFGEEIVPHIHSKPPLEQFEAHIQANLLSLFTASVGLCHGTGKASGAGSTFSSKTPQLVVPGTWHIHRCSLLTHKGGQQDSELTEMVHRMQLLGKKEKFLVGILQENDCSGLPKLLPNQSAASLMTLVLHTPHSLFAFLDPISPWGSEPRDAGSPGYGAAVFPVLLMAPQLCTLLCF